MKTGYHHLRCGLIGEHLGHSFSGPIHQRIADYSYDLRELTPEEVGDFVLHSELDAFNVTIPYKKTVLPYLDRISPEARRIGSVNTVVRRPDGTIDGYNTDYFGFDAMLTASGIPVAGKKALVLGTGGASLTVCTVLHDRGVGQLVVVGRTSENNYENIHRHHDADLIVNTTPVGMYPHNGVAPIRLADFKSCAGVLDLIYNPARTALLLEAEALGIPFMNGLYMLVAQAVKAFEFFTGDEAEAGIIDAITEELSREKQNIVLVGMPGCGKSTVGKRIAALSGRPFLDADDAFCDRFGISPAQVITAEGEERFRQMEHQVLTDLGKQSGAVIACGGGAVTRSENYHPLHQNGIIVYLRRDLSLLTSKGRPLSAATSPEELYRRRRAFYEAFADLTADATEVPDQTAALILSAVAAYKK